MSDGERNNTDGTDKTRADATEPAVMPDRPTSPYDPAVRQTAKPAEQSPLVDQVRLSVEATAEVTGHTRRRQESSDEKHDEQNIETVVNLGIFKRRVVRRRVHREENRIDQETTRRWFVRAAISLVVAVGVVILVNLFTGRGRSKVPGKKMRVPLVVGLNVADASKRLTDAEFVVKSPLNFQESDQPEGTVIKSMPASADGEQNEGQDVELVVASAPLIILPDVRDKSLVEATRILTDAKFVVKTPPIFRLAPKPANVVLYTVPNGSAGKLRKGTLVELIVATPILNGQIEGPLHIAWKNRNAARLWVVDGEQIQGRSFNASTLQTKSIGLDERFAGFTRVRAVAWSGLSLTCRGPMAITIRLNSVSKIETSLCSI